MQASADTLNLSPPPPVGMGRALGLALLAHVLLVAALTWGVQWNHSPTIAVGQVELWPAPPQTPPAPEQPPKPVLPSPEPEPSPPAPPPTPPAIVTQQEKPKPVQARPAPPRERETARLAQEQARQIELQRQENVKRIAGLANSTNYSSTGPTPTGASGSAGYAARLSALFKHNITFVGRDSIVGNPKATVMVRVGPDGRILNWRLAKPSGSSAWDEAVLAAVAKTERIPPDTDGRYVQEFPVDFGPKD